jgi:hypothetical protein
MARSPMLDLRLRSTYVDWTEAAAGLTGEEAVRQLSRAGRGIALQVDALRQEKEFSEEVDASLEYTLSTLHGDMEKVEIQAAKAALEVKRDRLMFSPVTTRRQAVVREAEIALGRMSKTANPGVLAELRTHRQELFEFLRNDGPGQLLAELVG